MNKSIKCRGGGWKGGRVVEWKDRCKNEDVMRWVKFVEGIGQKK